MPFSAATRGAILNFYFGSAPTVTKPAGLVMSLHSSDPGLTGSGELSGGGYARQTVTFGAESNGVVQSAADVEFTDLPAATIGWIGIWDTSGVYHFGAALGTPKVVAEGDFFRVPRNGTITLQ